MHNNTLFFFWTKNSTDEEYSWRTRGKHRDEEYFLTKRHDIFLNDVSFHQRFLTKKTQIRIVKNELKIQSSHKEIWWRHYVDENNIMKLLGETFFCKIKAFWMTLESWFWTIFTFSLNTPKLKTICQLCKQIFNGLHKRKKL